MHILKLNSCQNKKLGHFTLWLVRSECTDPAHSECRLVSSTTGSLAGTPFSCHITLFFYQAIKINQFQYCSICVDQALLFQIGMFLIHKIILICKIRSIKLGIQRHLNKFQQLIIVGIRSCHTTTLSALQLIPQLQTGDVGSSVQD